LTNYSKKTVKRKLNKQNAIKYATWNVRGITGTGTGQCIKTETN